MQNKLRALDGIRGLAAMYVLIHHARLGLTQSYHNGLATNPENYQWYDKLTVYAFGFFKYGHEAVIIFFVLSGFLIHLRQAHSKFEYVDFNIKLYLRKRILRIYPTLFASFLISITCDLLISSFAKGFKFVNYNIETLLCNIFLIPESPPFGTNFPIWSLKHEWFFYVVYPLFLWLSTKNKLFPIFLSTIMFLSYAFGYRVPIIGGAIYTFAIWLIGAILAHSFVNHIRINLFFYLPILIVVYPFFDRETQNYSWNDLFFALITAGIFSLILANKADLLVKFLQRFSWLGMFSYSLYLLHTPMINLYGEILKLKYHGLPFHLWFVLLASITTPIIIYILYYFTERLALNYKKRMKN